jgi:hypothetical protein
MNVCGLSGNHKILHFNVPWLAPTPTWINLIMRRKNIGHGERGIMNEVDFKEKEEIANSKRLKSKEDSD